jgi:hypothetical protein
VSIGENEKTFWSQPRATNFADMTGKMRDKKLSKIIRLAVSEDANRVITDWATKSDMTEIRCSSGSLTRL